MCKSKIPYTDLKPTIKKFILDKWQKLWDNQTQNKLHEIQEAIWEWLTGHRSIGREEVILARLRIGHTHITHSHLLKGEDASVCPTCKVQLTTKHILLNCNNLKHIRTKYYQTRNLRDIFKNTNPENIFNFLKKKKKKKKKKLFQQDITKHLHRTATLMTEIQNNLFGIKWSTGVDMPLNKTPTYAKLNCLAWNRNVFHMWFDCSDFINHIWAQMLSITFFFLYIPGIRIEPATK